MGCMEAMTKEKMVTEARGVRLPVSITDGNALIYVVRPLGTFGRTTIFLDGEDEDCEMGYMSGAQYIYFYVTPGHHQIMTRAGKSAEVIIDAEEGDIIFLRQEIKPGGRIGLVEIDAIEGRYHLKNASLGTITRTRK